MTTFDLNGAPVEASGDHPHLLAALRDELGITSPKDGCAPSGQCGCCTVLVNGKARIACQTSMEKAEGASITTLEGLPDDERERYATAFAAHGALQCGFCTPGILMRTKALVDKKGTALTRDDASRHLGAHLCRCTGYVKILDAVESLASGGIPVAMPRGGIGTSGVKVEATELSLGDRPFIDDMAPLGMLHAALRLADHARADVVRIDTMAAEAVDGVHRVLTAADIPGKHRVGIIHTDWPVMIPEGGRTSYLGDVLISCERAAAQAQTGSHSLMDELRLLTVHGVLHLLGHDHAEPDEKARMWAAQNEILREVGALSVISDP